MTVVLCSSETSRGRRKAVPAAGALRHEAVASVLQAVLVVVGALGHGSIVTRKEVTNRN